MNYESPHDLIKLNLSVFPVVFKNKIPAIKGGFLSSSNDPDVINAWTSEFTVTNWGIATGYKSQVFVLDIDPRNGGDETIHQLEKRFGRLPDTWTAVTGGQGYHYYFHCPYVDLKCRTSLFKGIDIKANGGYVVAPGSTHSSGNKYFWDLSPEQTNLSKAPSWLLKKLQDQQACSNSKYNWNQEISSRFTEGERYEHVLSLAGLLLNKGISEQLTFGLINSVNRSLCIPPLPDKELMKMYFSLLKKRGGHLWKK